MIKYIFFLLFSLTSFAETNLYFCQDSFENLPVQAGGRVKPYLVLAEESIKHLTGKTKVDGLNAVKSFCLLSLQGMGLPNELNVKIRVDHIDVKKFLEMNDGDSSIEVKKALVKKELLRGELMSQKENNSYKKDLEKVFGRLNFYEQITAGEIWTFPVLMNDQIEWQPLTTFLTEDKVKNHAAEGDKFKALFNDAKSIYIEKEGDNYLLELTYSKSKVFVWSMLTVLMAIILLVVVKNQLWGNIFIILTLLLEIAGMVMRIYISGRAPITNMYETVMFSGFGALLIGFFITMYKKDKLFVLSGLGYNLLCLLMMKFANNMLNPSINTLVPVLRDNFWLSTHVTTIILSYAALALSWMLSNIVLIKETFSKVERSEMNYYVSLIYTCMKFGVVLLSAGIILGGVWADYSWGRFWGWDPKETWSLIVLLIYMAILHGKYTNWINVKNFIPLTAAAFLSVMMAWFGVNYILASGLHSYGFSEGGAMFLIVFFLVQVGVLVISWPKIHKALS
jgi:cytochrome c-type biogenesis protein CcsB